MKRSEFRVVTSFQAWSMLNGFMICLWVCPTYFCSAIPAINTVVHRRPTTQAQRPGSPNSDTEA
eukprot:5139883-Pyramimonas_sp.AAC.2